MVNHISEQQPQPASAITLEQLQTWLAQRPADTERAWELWSATALTQFWQHTQVHQLDTADDVQVSYVSFTHPEPSNKGWVVISPGRIESYLKYQEIFLELAAQGYSVVAIDHRGQGFSERTSHHPQHGHIAQFDEFVRDFADFMLALKPLIGDQPCHLLAHSMGGAIGCLYMANYPHPFKSAVLSAPMMGVQTHPWPEAIARALVRVGHWVNQRFAGDKPRYFIGMRDYAEVSFADNRLTHSPQRYQWFKAMYQQHPQIQLGGPTVQWLKQSFQAMTELPEASQRIRIPVLILQATEDAIVSPQPQGVFVELAAHPQTRLHRIEGSYHEVLMETDAIRQPAVQSAFEFFTQAQELAPLEKSFAAPVRPKRSKELAKRR